MVRATLLALTLTLLAACAVGPEYRRPVIDVPLAFKEQQDWQPSQPADALQRGPWWEIFQDPVLSQLEVQVNVSNQNIKAAAAAYDQARAVVSQSHAAFWPSVNASATRDQAQSGTAPRRTMDTVGATASWDVDIWGQLRRTNEGNLANAQASAAALAGARLSAQAALASAYFEIRAQDELRRLLDNTVAGE